LVHGSVVYKLQMYQTQAVASYMNEGTRFNSNGGERGLTAGRLSSLRPTSRPPGPARPHGRDCGGKSAEAAGSRLRGGMVRGSFVQGRGQGGGRATGRAARAAPCANARGSCDGEGGTDPTCILRTMDAIQLQPDKLVMITDESLVRTVRERAQEAKRWNSTEAHIIATRPDTTVIAPFIADVSFEVYGPDNTLVSRCTSDTSAIVRLVQSID
jgi:hypothetical protein